MRAGGCNSPPDCCDRSSNPTINTIYEANHSEAVYIIHSEGMAYHQHEVLYIIKPQADTR